MKLIYCFKKHTELSQDASSSHASDISSPLKMEQPRRFVVCFHGEMIVAYHLRHFSETVTAKLKVHEFN